MTILACRELKSYLNILQIFWILTFVRNHEAVKFDKKYIGVVFSPHVKNAEGYIHTGWNNYTFEEVETMLLLVSSKFQFVSTFGMGTRKRDQSWKDGDAVGFTGMAAAELNKKKSSTLIRALLGVWQHNNIYLLDAEIRKTFNIAREANEIHAGTVWGVTLTSDYVWDYATTAHVLKMKAKGEQIMRATNNSVKIGVRLGPQVCMEAMYLTKTGNEYIKKLITSVDYILCQMFLPTIPIVGVQQYAAHSMHILDNIRYEMKRINANIIVIGENGWPSSGRHPDMIASNDNMVNYWKEIARISIQKQLRVNMFEAIDEPWKNILTNSKEASNGPCGSEGHFGWWRRTNNNITSLDAYVEKINDKQLLNCEEWETLQRKEPQRQLITWRTILLLLFFFIALALVLYFLFKKLKTSKVEKLAEEDIKDFENGIIGSDSTDLDNVEVALRLPYDIKFELEREKCVINKKCVLGRGEFGIVFKGKIQDGPNEVAFKTTKPRCPVENFKSLLAEIKLMIYIGDNINIVGLVGVFTGDIRYGIVYIAMEFCSLGSLQHQLRLMDEHKRSASKFVASQETQTGYGVSIRNFETLPQEQLKKLYNWSSQIANGMEYLSSKHVVHSDLATRNILLNEKEVVKISDFGLSRQMYNYCNYVKEKKKKDPLPWKWMAIESLRTLTFSTQSDIWGYGITMWEIFSLGAVPYPGISWSPEFLGMLENGTRNPKPNLANSKVYSVMLSCWDIEPRDRPSFNSLKIFFQTLTIDSLKNTNCIEDEPEPYEYLEEIEITTEI